MTLATRSPCAPWSRQGFFWLSIFCFTSAINISVSQCKQLDTVEKISATCGENVILTCNDSNSMLAETDLKKFVWENKNGTLCQYGQKNQTSKFKCESANTTSKLTLTLTILNIIPADRGEYHCKLHSSKETCNGKSSIKIEDCPGDFKFSTDDNNVTCFFDGVYPSGIVHWYQQSENLTHYTSSEAKPKGNELYKVQSTIKKEKLNSSKPFNCSLWVPSLNRYISTTQTSSATASRLHWICIMILLAGFAM